MSKRLDDLKAALDDLDHRIKLAENAHQAAKSTFSRYEGSASSPMWEKLRQEVDDTLTHSRVLQAHWHRTKADLLERLNIEKSS
jgi:hypothetical protein